MEIKLKCCCGAELYFADDSGTILIDNKTEENSKPLVEWVADNWMQNHICNDRPVKLE